MADQTTKTPDTIQQKTEQEGAVEKLSENYESEIVLSPE